MCTTYGYNCQYPVDESPTAQYVDQPHSGEPSSRASISEDHSSHLLKPERDEKEMERSKSPDAVDRGILDPFKGRYMGLHSAVAFPRAVGLDLQSSNPPRVHSFAWNCGIRPEESSPIHHNISTLVTKEDYEHYSAVYFEAVHPIFGIICPTNFRSRCEAYFEPIPPRAQDYNAVIASVIALGSFFSAEKKCANEHLLVAHAKEILEDPVFVRAPNLNLVMAHLLRTIYLRATTRPHVSWIESCTTLHCAEATGLHREIDRGVVLTSEQSPEDTTTPNKPLLQGQQPSWGFGRKREGCETTRRLFWSAWALNRMISYEYGRSFVLLNGITTKLPKVEDGDFTHWLIQIARLIPHPQVGTMQVSGAQSSTGAYNTADTLLKTLARLDEIPDSHPFISLSKADLAMSVYRRLRLLSFSPQILTTKIISLGRTALGASLELMGRRHFWWQTLCSVFQYICVLLAMDDTRGLLEINAAMETLEKVSDTLGTHVSSEAVNTAKLLIRDSRRKKKRELQLLEDIVGEEEVEDDRKFESAHGGTIGGATELVNGVGKVESDTIAGQWNWQLDEVDWNALLDPGFGFLPQELGAF